MNPVGPADPASCSLTAGSLRQLATRLRIAGRGAHEAFDAAGQGGRGGTVLASARRRADVVDAAAAAAAHELDRVGSALQAHASEIAEAVAGLRRLRERAEAVGLRLHDGVLEPAWGVSGVADGAASASREADRSRLQGELDQATAVLDQRRQRLRATLTESTAVLARHAAGLRR